MSDGLPRGYDAWRTRSREDEEEVEERRRLRDEMLMDRADEMRDRERDEKSIESDLQTERAAQS